jgi:hypothetical protein
VDYLSKAKGFNIRDFLAAKYSMATILNFSVNLKNFLWRHAYIQYDGSNKFSIFKITKKYSSEARTKYFFSIRYYISEAWLMPAWAPMDLSVTIIGWHQLGLRATSEPRNHLGIDHVGEREVGEHARKATFRTRGSVEAVPAWIDMHFSRGKLYLLRL